ncbi:MAG: porin [Alistipes sp.]
MRQIIALMFMLFCLCTHAAAQESPVSGAVDDSLTIAQLTARVEQIEKHNQRWDKVVSQLPRISGFLQLGYKYADESSSFFVKRARVSFAGDLAPKLDYRLQIEFASPKIVDVFMRYRPFDALNVQLGEYKLPFTIENTEYNPLNCEFVQDVLAMTYLVGLNDLSGIQSSGRDLGAMIYGGFARHNGRDVLSYNLGVFNGEGINTWDKNKSKDVVARLMVRPVDGLVLSGSYYWGEYSKEHLARTRFSAGGCYDRGRVVVRGEYIGGTTDALKSGGWYALCGIRATKSLLAAVRYDTFRRDRFDSDTRQTNYTAALTWQPIKYLRCQLDYTYENFAAPQATNHHVVSLLFTGIF